eukprot:512362-Pyramimonas_sp.AAC.1
MRALDGDKGLVDHFSALSGEGLGYQQRGAQAGSLFDCCVHRCESIMDFALSRGVRRALAELRGQVLQRASNLDTMRRGAQLRAQATVSLRP